MIIAFGGIKGGSGKTTLATNLTYLRAELGKNVLLVDADDQRSASDWVEHREAQGFHTPWTTIQLSGPAVRTQVQKMVEKFDDILIDTGGRDTQSQRAALAIADLFISPFQPRSYDVWTIGKLNNLILEMASVNVNLKAYAVINRGDVKGVDNDDTREILTEVIKCLPTIICQRKAFSNSASQGLSVIEIKNPDKKAIQEMRDLHDTIFAS